MNDIKKVTQLREAGEKLEKARREVKIDSKLFEKAVKDNIGVTRHGNNLKNATERLRRAQKEYDKLT